MQEALVYAVGVAVSPVAIGTVLLILSSSRAIANAVSFAGGWIAGVATSVATVTLVVAGLDLSDSGPLWIALPEIALGATFLGVAAKLWTRPASLETPPWLDAVDRFTRTRSVAVGFVLSGANPKVLALALGAALSLAETGEGLRVTTATIVLFTGIGSAGALVPIAAFAAFPAQADVRLAQLRRWLVTHERVVLILLALAIGAFFIRDGIRSLTT